MSEVKKFGLFEFEDDSVEVCPLEWVMEPIGGCISVDDNVKLAWPGNGKGQGSGIAEHNAIVLAVSENELKLRDKRNRVCKGFSIETDRESGRGFRRKTPKRKFTDITSSSSESDISDIEVQDEEVDFEPKKAALSKTKKTKVIKKKGADQGLAQIKDMASQLRKQLLGSDADAGCDASLASTSHEDDIDSIRGELFKVEGKLKKEMELRQKLQEKLNFLQGVPTFISTFQGFMDDMNSLTRQTRMTVSQFDGESRPSTTSPSVNRNVPLPTISMQPSTPQSSNNESASGIMSDMVTLGPGATVRRSKLRGCNHGDASKLTCDLMLLLFGREELCRCSLTGAANSRGETKPPLDKKQVEAIIAYVMSKFPETPKSKIRQSMTYKLSNETKLKRRRTILAEEEEVEEPEDE